MNGRLIQVEVIHPEAFGEGNGVGTELQFYHTGDFSPFVFNLSPALRQIEMNLRQEFRKAPLDVRYATVQECIYYQIMHLFVTGQVLCPTLVAPDRGVRTGYLIHMSQNTHHSGTARKPEDLLYLYRVVVEWSNLYPGHRGSDSYLLPIVEFN